MSLQDSIHREAARLAALAPVAQTTPASSSDNVGVWPYIAAIGGQAADGASTVYNFGRGYSESNGLYGDGQPTGRVLSTKIAAALGSALLMRYLQKHGQAAAAKVLGYSVGAAGAVPAVINVTRPDLKR